MSRAKTPKLCGSPSKTLGPCDQPWGHAEEMHASLGDGFYARDFAELTALRAENADLRAERDGYKSAANASWTLADERLARAEELRKALREAAKALEYVVGDFTDSLVDAGLIYVREEWDDELKPVHAALARCRPLVEAKEPTHAK